METSTVSPSIIDSNIPKEHQKYFHYHKNNNNVCSNSFITKQIQLFEQPLKHSVPLQFPVECHPPENIKQRFPYTGWIFCSPASSTNSRNSHQHSNKSERSINNNYIESTSSINPSTSLDFSQPPNQAVCLELHGENHTEEDNSSEVHLKRPWWLWCIGIVDVLSAIWYASLIAYDFHTNTTPDSETYFWKVPLTIISIMARLSMGACLLVGLKSEEQKATLRYAKIWVFVQLTFIASSVLEVIAGVLQYATPNTSPKTEELPPEILKILAVFVYRVVTFIMVRLFMGKMRRTDCIELEEETSGGFDD